MLRGTSSPLDDAIEKKTTGASCPWNLQRLAQIAHLRVVGRDDHEVGLTQRPRPPLRVGVVAAEHLLDRRPHALGLLDGRPPVALVLHRQEAQAGPERRPLPLAPLGGAEAALVERLRDERRHVGM